MLQLYEDYESQLSITSRVEPLSSSLCPNKTGQLLHSWLWRNLTAWLSYVIIIGCCRRRTPLRWWSYTWRLFLPRRPIDICNSGWPLATGRWGLDDPPRWTSGVNLRRAKISTASSCRRDYSCCFRLHKAYKRRQWQISWSGVCTYLIVSKSLISSSSNSSLWAESSSPTNCIGFITVSAHMRSIPANAQSILQNIISGTVFHNWW